MNKVDVHSFFDEATKSVSYIVIDQASKQAAVIDPVLDFNPETGALGTEKVDEIIDFLDDNNLDLEWILETHIHADHITAAQYLREQRGGQIGISEHVVKVQSTYRKTFQPSEQMSCDGSEFDYLFQDDEVIFLGHIEMEVIGTPGHSPACVSYKIEDALFVGDVLAMPDKGTSRTDYPCSSAKAMYQSIQKIFSLSDSTRIFVGHAKKTSERENVSWETTVLQEKRDNIHLKHKPSEAEFVHLRRQLDQGLTKSPSMPAFMLVNIQAGRLPKIESDGIRYLKFHA
jgi:glyoxylase-like metal-dependent hydrolase (beta-lactamase superfamily II)